MRSRPAGGFGLVLFDDRSQLKSKPNDAGAMNTGLAAGSCPPPRPLHAASDTTSTPVAMTDTNRRRDAGTRKYMAALPSRRAGSRGSPPVHHQCAGSSTHHAGASYPRRRLRGQVSVDVLVETAVTRALVARDRAVGQDVTALQH